jgi:uncharacterized protein (DUF1501 family)
MRDLTRRQFITRLVQAGGLLSLPALGSEAFAQTAFAGKLLITVQCQGAWDVTSFCDPKMNTEINNWARARSIGTAGRLRYAPFGINQQFFDKHYSKMLVINGVDMQTNAHETGETVVWSGRTALGYPSLPALYATTYAPGLALAYLNLGGWGNTEGVINITRIYNSAELGNVIYPNVDNGNSSRKMLADSDLARVQALQQQVMQNKLAEQNAMPQDLLNRQNFRNALMNSEGLKAFGALIPKSEDIQKTRRAGALDRSTIHQQVQTALLAFKSGLCVAADVREGGFDTHEYHDRDHEPVLSVVLDAVNYLWDYAEQLGLADRIVVLMGSDFGRTPYYNANQGKDHWNIGSYVVMEKNKTYTNRIIGETDGGHNAMPINPQTLLRDDAQGTLIYSNHVHKALRKYLGLENQAVTKMFPFNNTADFGFFG